MYDVPDEVLIGFVQDGNREALEQFYNRHERLIYSFALRCVGNSTVAEEIVQDVFLKVWRTTSRYDPGIGKVTTWLLSITRFTAIDYHRRKKSPPVSGGDSDNVAMLNYADPAPGPESTAELSQLRTTVRQAMQGLPVDQRDVIEGMYFLGKTQHEIANENGLSLGTVKSRARLAMRKLRERFTADGLGVDEHA